MFEIFINTQEFQKYWEYFKNFKIVVEYEDWKKIQKNMRVYSKILKYLEF
jgi:hypothetical protein